MHDAPEKLTIGKSGARRLLAAVELRHGDGGASWRQRTRSASTAASTAARSTGWIVAAKSGR